MKRFCDIALNLFGWMMIGFIIVAIFTHCSSSASAAVVSEDSTAIYLTQHEGFKHIPYRDGSQWCAGIGHRIDGERKLHYYDEEIYSWFHADFAAGLHACRRGIYHFDDLPSEAQLVSLGLWWTTGDSGFIRFHDFRNYLSRRNYKKAAHALRDSKWWNQVSPHRAQESAGWLSALGDEN